MEKSEELKFMEIKPEEALRVRVDVFNTLNKIDVSKKVEEKTFETKKGKMKLSYLPWAWAWSEVKKKFPGAFYTIYHNKEGWNYFTDGRTCWVETGVTIEGLEHIEHLAVMDNANKSIRLEDVTSCDVNKSIQRSLTKACARHGLGLYVYAGEDLPEDSEPKPIAEEDVLELVDRMTSYGALYSDVLKAVCDLKGIDLHKAAEVVKKYSPSGKADDMNLKQLKSVVNEVCQ